MRNIFERHDWDSPTSGFEGVVVVRGLGRNRGRRVGNGDALGVQQAQLYLHVEQGFQVLLHVFAGHLVGIKLGKWGQRIQKLGIARFTRRTSRRDEPFCSYFGLTGFLSRMLMPSIQMLKISSFGAKKLSSSVLSTDPFSSGTMLNARLMFAWVEWSETEVYKGSTEWRHWATIIFELGSYKGSSGSNEVSSRWRREWPHSTRSACRGDINNNLFISLLALNVELITVSMSRDVAFREVKSRNTKSCQKSSYLLPHVLDVGGLQAVLADEHSLYLVDRNWGR